MFDPVPSQSETRLLALKRQFEQLSVGRADLLRILDESEIPESVFNSNAIENSTLTLEETEQILLAVEISRHMDLREVHEAQNLGRVTEYIRKNHSDRLDLERLCLLHQMLLGNIDESIAGRFRRSGEFVRVGTHIAPAPEQIDELLVAMLVTFEAAVETHPVMRVARLHLEFERIHPFNDGNGRIGRLLANHALYRLGFPPVIIRNKGKMKYYDMLRQYDTTGNTKQFEVHLTVLLLESLHRRVAYLRGAKLQTCADFARANQIDLNALLNKARRQVAPAFRERGVWKIPSDFTPVATP